MVVLIMERILKGNGKEIERGEQNIFAKSWNNEQTINLNNKTRSCALLAARTINS